MSASNHRRMTKLGWISKDTPTCFPEALDLITPEAGVTWDTYKQYGDTMSRWTDCPSSDLNTNRHNATIKKLYTLIALDLGNYEFNDFIFKNATTSSRLEGMLDEFIDGGLRPVVDLVSRSGDIHTVGVKKFDDGLYCLRGNGQPTYLRNRSVTASAIMHHLVDCGRTTGFVRSYPFQAVNVAAIPTPPAGFVSLSI